MLINALGWLSSYLSFESQMLLITPSSLNPIDLIWSYNPNFWKYSSPKFGQNLVGVELTKQKESLSLVF